MWRKFSNDPEMSWILDQLWHVDCCSTVSVLGIGHGHAVDSDLLPNAISFIRSSSLFIQLKAGQPFSHLSAFHLQYVRVVSVGKKKRRKKEKERTLLDVPILRAEHLPVDNTNLRIVCCHLR